MPARAASAPSRSSSRSTSAPRRDDGERAQHPLAKDLGADVVVDYRTSASRRSCSDYDLVFDTQGGETLARSFDAVHTRRDHRDDRRQAGREVRPRAWGLNPALVFVLGLSTADGAPREKRGVHFEYLFMRPDGAQLAAIAKLLASGAIEPVIDKVFPSSRRRKRWPTRRPGTRWARSSSRCLR